MTKGYVIRVIGERSSDIHRTRNFAEELRVELKRRGFGTTSDPDSVMDTFRIEVSKKQYLGNTSKLIHELVAKHLMKNDVQIEKI